MLKLLLFCSALQVVYSTCPSPLTLVAGGECRGKAIASSTSLNSAVTVTYCTADVSSPGGYLVAIHNDEQQAYWSAKKSSNYLVIGLVCNTGTKRWGWVDGTTLDYKPSSGNYDTELDADCKTGCSWFIEKNGAWHINCASTSANVDYYCITEIKRPPVASDDCGNFDEDSDDGVCYEIVKQAETWKDAQSTCHDFGAEVASVHNPQQNSYIRRLAVSKGAKNGVLLGGTVSGKGTDFGWIDGSDWDYTNFYPSFPIDGLGECLTMDTVSTAGQWMNTDCATKVPVVCARPYYNSPEEAGCLAGPWKEGQIIYSPGFPDDASVPCDYFLTVPTGKKVKLEILLLEANSCCDYAVITDGYVAGPIVANLTGEISGKYYYTSASNTMRVSWQPNGGVNVRGLMMSFWAN